MGAISIGLPRGSSPVQLDGSSLQNGESRLVCFLSYCYGLPANSLHHCGIICRDCDIRTRHGIRVCRTITLTCCFLARDPAATFRDFDSDSTFVLRPNYTVLSSVLAALLFAASS